MASRGIWKTGTCDVIRRCKMPIPLDPRRKPAIISELSGSSLGCLERGAAWLAARFPTQATKIPIVRTWYVNNEHFKFAPGDIIDCASDRLGYGEKAVGWRVSGFTEDLRHYAVIDECGNERIFNKSNIEVHFVRASLVKLPRA